MELDIVRLHRSALVVPQHTNALFVQLQQQLFEDGPGTLMRVGVCV